MPDRLIRESWCASETIDRLTPFEETVLARLIVNCDDFGRMDGRTNVLCSRLFVTRRDVGAEQMRAAIAALEREGLVLRYAVAGKEYIQMRGWGEHQRIRTQRSKYPAPPDAAEASRGISLAYHAADALPGNAESGQAVLPAGALPEGTVAGQAVSGAAMRPDHVAAHVSPAQTADAGQAAEMLPGNAGNAQAALPGGTVWGDPAGGEFGAHGNAPAESHPYSMAGSVPVPPGAMPGQPGAQANFAIARPAAECRDLPQPAATCRRTPRPAATCRRMQQHATTCRRLRQLAADCRRPLQLAARIRIQSQSESQSESESNSLSQIQSAHNPCGSCGSHRRRASARGFFRILGKISQKGGARRGTRGVSARGGLFAAENAACGPGGAMQKRELAQGTGTLCSARCKLAGRPPVGGDAPPARGRRGRHRAAQPAGTGAFADGQ